MTDFTVDARTRMLALFKSGNPVYRLLANDFTLGPPFPYNLDSVRNTRVLIIAVGARYQSRRSWFYVRDDLQLVFNQLADSMVGVTLDLSSVIAPTTTADLLPAVLSQYGVNLLPADVVVESLDTTGNYTIKANSGSYGWIGQVPVTYTGVLDAPTGFKLLRLNGKLLQLGGKYAVLANAA